MELHVFLYLAVIFAAGYCIKLVTNAIKIPEVTGYVILGVLLGPSLFRLLTPRVLDALGSLSTIALGLIAFMIGIELKLDVIRRLGKSILAIVTFESVGAFVSVFLILRYLFRADINTSLLLGAVASATAPAATVAVIKQYRAKGPLTSTILAVVGIDDAFALIIYVFVESFVSSNLLGQSVNMPTMIGSALLSILLAVGIGFAIAIVYGLILRNVRNNDAIVLLLAAAIFALLGICELLGVSELLSVMTFGMVIVNSSPTLSKKSENIVSNFSPIFLTAFFILGGAHLDIALIGKIGVLGLVYFLARSLGKMGGATIGAIIGKAPAKVRKYVGFALLPQVGVALALALAIDKKFGSPQFGAVGASLASTVINVLLFTTIITEIIGPLLTRFALTKAGKRIPSRNTADKENAMNLLIIELSQLDYKEDVFLALQSVGITKASAFDAKNLNRSLESEFSLFTGFFQSRNGSEGERLIITAPVESPDTAKELLSNLEAGGIPVRDDDILSLVVVPVALAFNKESGLHE